MPAPSRPGSIDAEADEPISASLAIELDERTVVRRTREIEQEREIAIYDLLEGQQLRAVGLGRRPLQADARRSRRTGWSSTSVSRTTSAHGKVMLSLTPFRSVIKDYFLICESYFKAIRNAPPSQIEALDMGRRGLHNEGSTLLRERLKGKIEVDFDTARRLFTLICVLHLKG